MKAEQLDLRIAGAAMISLLLLVFVVSRHTGSNGTPAAWNETATTIQLSYVSSLPQDESSTLVSSDKLPTPGEVVSAVRDMWPNNPEAAEALLHCESRSGADPRTWDSTRPDGGPLQINRFTWEAYFLESYGWSWEEIVLDLETHLYAAREIYDLSGGWQEWSCWPSAAQS